MSGLAGIRTPAERIARQLIAVHGTVQARREAEAKRDQARAQQDRNFWIAVLENLR